MSLNGNLEGEYRLRGKVTTIPEIDRTLTKSGKTADAKATGDALALRVKKTDIVDNLKSFDTDKPLSARQGTELKILIEGKKTTGEYVGNGSAETRTISAGGIGSVVLVYTADYFSFVTPEVTMVVALSDGMISRVDSSQAYYRDGNLILNTDDAAFNTLETTYHYQVL